MIERNSMFEWLQQSINLVWLIVQSVCFFFLVMPWLWLAVRYLFGYRGPAPVNLPNEADYAIIVTAYGHVAGVKEAVLSLLKLNYHQYHIYVVLDNCGDGDIGIAHDQLTVLRPTEVLAGNTRSHFYAIQRFIRPHERVTIVDNDNLVHRDYLNALNRYFDAGYRAVQGVRKPKNLNTTLACLDAARDAYYHYYDGKLLFEIGSSATLAGSGMAFEVSLYRECLEHLDVRGAGFDKVLQYEIVKRGHRIAFANEAWVYDEKTSDSRQLVKQRSRWINTWFKYFRFGGTLVLNAIRRMDRNAFFFGVVLLRPPLFLFLSVAVVAIGVSLWQELYGYALIWMGGLGLFVLGFLLALRLANMPRSVYAALSGIPRFVYYQFISLLNSKRANRISVATEHSVVKTIDEIETTHHDHRKS